MPGGCCPGASGKSAEQGNADAQCWLGLCYDLGKGVGQDYGEAMKWLRKAAEQGNKSAKDELEKILQSHQFSR